MRGGKKKRSFFSLLCAFFARNFLFREMGGADGRTDRAVAVAELGVDLAAEKVSNVFFAAIKDSPNESLGKAW